MGNGTLTAVIESVIWATVAVILILFFIVSEALDWGGRVEYVRSHYPRLYELATWIAEKRLLRVVLVVIAIGMLARAISVWQGSQPSPRREAVTGDMAPRGRQAPEAVTKAEPRAEARKEEPAPKAEAPASRAEGPKPSARVTPRSEPPKPEAPATPPPPMFIDPVVEVALGNPLRNDTIITVQNSGVETVVDTAVYIRCFQQRHMDDIRPGLMWWGIPTIDNAKAWWKIGDLEPNKPATKDAIAVMASCLEGTDTRNTRLMFLLAADVVYRRKSDRKQYSQRDMMALYHDTSTSTVVFWSLFERTAAHLHMLRNCYPPGWERFRQAPSAGVPFFQNVAGRGIPGC